MDVGDGSGRMSTANRFGGACANRECSIYVAPRQGVVTRTPGGWVTWCAKCGPESDRAVVSGRTAPDAGPEPADERTRV